MDCEEDEQNGSSKQAKFGETKGIRTTDRRREKNDREDNIRIPSW
jgi:hypothetical protein